MKLVFLPTLTDMRDMLGEDLYVKFVWMWREQEQDARALERRQRMAAMIPQRQAQSWPMPIFARAERKEERPAPAALPGPAQAFQATLLRVPRAGETIEVGDLAGLIDRVREEPREAAIGGRRRRR
ncbi:MAG: hypothetical protein ABSD74_13055 [Rhizomicrobium sp.]|jgi:hypothetical protein